MRTVPLRRIARILNGGTPTSAENNWGGDIEWATPVDLARTDGRVLGPTDRKLTEIGLATGSTLAPNNAILLSTRAPIGYTSILATPTSFNQGCKAIVVSSLGDPRFLQFSLISQKESLQAAGSGSTFLELSNEALAEAPVFLFPVEDQRRIADFLDDRVARIDKIIAARQQQRLRNEEILCSLENKLTTIGSGDTRSTCIEWMPEISSEYEFWRVSRAFSTASGTTPRSDSSMYYGSGTPWITTSDLKDKIISLIPHSVTDESFRDYSALKKFPSGTLIVAMYGATVGRLGILESPAATNQACCAMLPSGPVDVWYAFHWFHAHRSHIMALASGGGQPNISQDLVRSLFIPAPNIKKQKEIVDILSGYQEDLREADDALIRQIDLLQEYKQSLITAAVTGEFDVTSASTRIPE